MRLLSFPVAIAEEPILEFDLDDRTRQILGEPHILDYQGRGLGPEQYWAFEFDCGLKVLLGGSIGKKHVGVGADEPEIEHVARHIDLRRGEYTPILVIPQRDHRVRRRELATCVLRRQDDNGNIFDVTGLTSRRDAECFLRSLTRAMHKQMYWIDEEKREVDGR